MACLCATTDAHADSSGGANVYNFEPSVSGGRFLLVPEATVVGHRKAWAWTVEDYGYSPHAWLQGRDEGSGVFGASQEYSHFGTAYSMWNRLQVDLNLPARWHTSDALGSAGVPRIGDLRLGSRVNVYGDPSAPYAVGIGVSAWLPTGSQSQATGDGAMRGNVSGIVSGSWRGVRYASNLGFLARKKGDYGNMTVGPAITFGAAAALELAKGTIALGPELWGYATIPSDGIDASVSRSTPIETMVSGHALMGDWSVGGFVGTALTSTPGTARLRIGLSLAVVPRFSFAPGDDDMDNITDGVDACPTVSGVASSDRALHGCPPPPDQDGDGISDPKDSCVDLPGIASEDPKKHGCPSDRDDDGIVDAKDACVDVAGVASSAPKRHGCPSDRDDDGIIDKDDACVDVPGVSHPEPAKNGCPADRDGDKIVDTEDACVDIPGLVSDDPKRNGCPLDRDGDGINDETDACVDQPGPADSDTAKNGCPLAQLTATQIVIHEQVHFATASARIQRESDKLLSAVAAILRDHPEIKLVTVEGHTDNRAKPKYNQQLSEQRAAAVATWLVKQGGIEASRVTSIGFGMDRPIADNTLQEGRATNRRVEFHISEK